MAGNDGRHPGFGVVLVVDVHAARADHFFGLQGVAIHQHELGRPVGAGNGNLVFPAFELGGFHRAGFQTDFDLSDVVGFFHPQVDQVQAGIAANHVQVAARSGQARDVHGVAGFDDVDDFLGITVDQGDRAVVTQGHREDVLDVVVVHLFGGALVHRDVFLAGCFHVGQGELGRCRGIVLDVAGHQVHGGFVELTRGQPVGHPGGGTVSDKGFEVLGAFVVGQIRGQRLAGCAFAQHTVATGAALKINLTGAGKFLLGHGRGFGVARLVHSGTGQGRCSALVLGFCRSGLGGGCARFGWLGHGGQRHRGQSQSDKTR